MKQLFKILVFSIVVSAVLYGSIHIYEMLSDSITKSSTLLANNASGSISFNVY